MPFIRCSSAECPTMTLHLCHFLLRHLKISFTVFFACHRCVWVSCLLICKRESELQAESACYKSHRSRVMQFKAEDCALLWDTPSPKVHLHLGSQVSLETAEGKLVNMINLIATISTCSPCSLTAVAYCTDSQLLN